MRQKLTDISIRQLPIPAKGSARYWDTVLPGFGVRVSNGGTKSFVVMYGRDRKLTTIGRYPDISLKTARTEAKRYLAGVSTEKPDIALTDALSAFLEDTRRRARPSTADGYWYRLKDIKRDKLSQVKQSDIPETPQHRMAIKVFFNWCVRHGYIEENPFKHLTVKFNTRDRVLTTDELKQIWHYEYPPYSDHLKFLILTGCRKGESAHFSRENDTIAVDGRYTKNGKRHVLPLTPLVETLYPLKPFNGWSKAKARLDKHVTIPHWTLHDLRRTFATRHAQLGTPIHVVEALLNHRSGTISGVAAVYIRHNFLKEARAAQMAYERDLASALSIPLP